MSDEFTFEDEPEDSWDVNDEPFEMARNLLRRLDALDTSTRFRTIEDMVGEIEQRIGPYHRRRAELSARDQLRFDQLIEDLDVLFERARHGG